MKWVTRKNANVNRIACPWLIRHFIDSEAEVLWVEPERVMELAEQGNAIPFDVRGVELGHADGRCSFESILLKYDLNDPACTCWAPSCTARADIPADIAIEPEAAGLRALAYGFATLYGDDDAEKLELQTPMYDALYTWCQERTKESSI